MSLWNDCQCYATTLSDRTSSTDSKYRQWAHKLLCGPAVLVSHHSTQNGMVCHGAVLTWGCRLKALVSQIGSNAVKYIGSSLFQGASCLPHTHTLKVACENTQPPCWRTISKIQSHSCSCNNVATLTTTSLVEQWLWWYSWHIHVVHAWHCA